MKMKKQFRLYDVYRTATMRQYSNIAGIREYEATITDDNFVNLTIIFYSYEQWQDSFPRTLRGEEKLKAFIRSVNRKLKNCRKPGPRPKN